ncbi:hypothetical protein, partial [Escherichia coli]|uniref:hypothetical protein n=1 Tax=Escherichia coli TaxID=562 RepID=UPI0020B3C5F0
RNRSHWSTSKTPSYTKSVSWQHHQKSIYLSCEGLLFFLLNDINYHSYIKTIMAVKNIWQGCELNDQTF